MPEGLEPRELDLRDYLRVLRRRRGTIALVVILVVGAAVAYSLYQNKVYEATAQVLVRTANAQTPGSTDQATEILLMEAPAVRGAATKKLDHVPDVSVSQIGTSSVVAVTARSSHPKQAARDATVYARTYIDVRRKQTLTELLASTNDIQTKIQQLDAQSEQLDQALAAAVDPTERTALVTSQSSQRNNLASQRAAYSAQLNQLQASVSAAGASRQLVAVASVPASPVEPKPLRNALIALVVGLVLGILAAFVREYFHDTVLTKEDVERVSGKLRVLGLIPAVKGWRNRKKAVLVSATAPNSRAAEAYRTLRTSLQFLALERPIRSIQVTSASAIDGKTTTVANLAVATARAGRIVVVVCCDLRRPRVHEFFGLTNDVGLTSVLLGEVSLLDALQTVDSEPGVLVLASGPPPPNPAELLATARTAEVMSALRERCDLLIVDSTPVLPVSDALIVAGLVDATLMVTTAGVTKKRGLYRAMELLDQVDAPVVGSVMSFPKGRSGYSYAVGSGYGYGTGYGYGHSAPKATAKPPAETPPETGTNGSGNGHEPVTAWVTEPEGRRRHVRRGRARR